MGELARWNLKVSRETDVALRTLLASRGGRKGDLSRFVEEAVNREVLRETVRDIQARNVDTDPGEVEKLIDEELAEIRSAFWTKRTANSVRVILEPNILLSGLISQDGVQAQLIEAWLDRKFILQSHALQLDALREGIG